ncbi:MAG: 4-hydroxy-3-methylbut-2-enyl diphosphate reductase [Alistipes sp.]|nr:4-hydroxy-3-methylbut-2-enyl diphosphate reductase [Alistipes sp.]
MYIEIDESSGFCFGVVRAISKAESALSSLGGEVYSLGDIVHNRMEVQRLEDMGLRTVTHDDMDALSGRDLFIRAHGEPPSTYSRAEALGIRIIDATCPVVAQLQRKVVVAHEQMREVNGQVVILGKRGHAEVVGLTGQVEAPSIVIEREEDLSLIDFSRPIFFLSQTTQSIGLFWRLADIMKARLGEESMLTVDDTICRRVSNREKGLTEFAQRFDVVIFVCGKKSSNGKVLFSVCQQANPRSYNVEEEAELQDEWFEGCKSVGICGATSTPAWLMERVAEAIRQRYV